jgi:hypothetical protein
LRRKFGISVALDAVDYPKVKEKLDSYGFPEFTEIFNRRRGRMTVYEDQEYVNDILKGLSSISFPGFHWGIGNIINHYTKKELYSFPYLHIMAESFIDINEKVKNLFYDYSNVCPDCDTGHIQSDDLIVKDRGKIGKIHFTKTHYFEYIVSRELGDFIIDSNFTGIELRDVHSATKKGIGYQLFPTNTLPPLKKNTYEYPPDWTCENCGYQGADMLGKFCGMDEYRIVSLTLDFKDFNKTFETFGCAGLARPEIVISIDVVKSLDQFKGMKITLDPVHVFDENGNELTPKILPKESAINLIEYKDYFGGNLKKDFEKCLNL